MGQHIIEKTIYKALATPSAMRYRVAAASRARFIYHCCTFNLVNSIVVTTLRAVN